MDPITVQIVDPQSSGISKEVLAAGAALAGAGVGGVIGWVSNWWTNKKADERQERQHKQDAEMLDKQLESQREALAIRARHEDRDRDVRIKLENVERAYRLADAINNNAARFLILLKINHRLKDEMSIDVMTKITNLLEKLTNIGDIESNKTSELYTIITLFFPSLLSEKGQIMLCMKKLSDIDKACISPFNEYLNNCTIENSITFPDSERLALHFGSIEERYIIEDDKLSAALNDLKVGLFRTVAEQQLVLRYKPWDWSETVDD